VKLEFPTAVPEIPVKDLAKAVPYYQKNLGFSLDWGGAEIGLAGFSRGRCRIFLADQEHRMECGNRGPVLTWLNLESNQQVDQLYRAWKATHAKLMSAPVSKPWGLHEFMARDLDGNLFRVFFDFGTHLRTASLAFTKRLREEIRSRRIRCSVRIWTGPHLKLGTKHAVDSGHIVVDSVEEISPDDITYTIARESGYRNAAQLRSLIKHGKGEQVYLIRFHYVPPRAQRPARARRSV
jgi:predicted lactoylglutathione lyase